jgi:hypothetical protein
MDDPTSEVNSQVQNDFLQSQIFDTLTSRQDLLTLAAQQLSFEHEQVNNLRQRQRPPRIEGQGLKIDTL